MSKPEGSVEHSLVTACSERRDSNKKCVRVRMIFISCGHICSRIYQTSQCFLLLELLPELYSVPNDIVGYTH